MVLATKDVITWTLYLHDRNHLVLSEANIYGSTILQVKNGQSFGHDYIVYAVIPTETNHIDQEQDRCQSQKVMDKENIWQCLEKYRDSFVNCTLPWRLYNMTQGHSLCQKPEEYEQFMDFRARLPEPNWTKNIAKCNPGCRRYGYSATIFESGMKKNKSAKFTFSLFFNQYELVVIQGVSSQV